MASKDQSTQKLVNELEKAVSTSKDLLKVVEKTDDVFKDMAESVKDSFSVIDDKTTKGIKDFGKAVSVVNVILEKQQQNNEKKKEITQDLTKQEKELIALKKKLADGLGEEIVATEKLKVQIQEQNKQRKIQAKQALGLLDLYQLESARLNKLRKEYKNLALQNKGNTKESKLLLKTITELDEKLKDVDATVGQNQRSVGKYKDAVKGLNSTIGKLGITAVIIKGVQLLTGAFGDSRDGALLMEKAMNTLTGTISVTIGRLTAAATSIKSLFDNASGFGVLTAMGKSISVLLNGFDGISEQVAETVENLNNVTELTQDYNIQIQALERSISSLNKSQRINLLIAENDTLSFKTRSAASDQAVEDAKVLGKSLRELSALQLDQQVKTIATQLKAKGVSIDVDSATAESVIKLLKVRENAGKIGTEVEQAFTESYVNNQNTILESSDILLDTLEKRNKLFSDEQELILDIQLDGLDNQKTINEKLIASDKETFDNRKELLDKTKKLFADGFEAQKKTVIDLNDKVIESEKIRIKNSVILTDIQKKEQLAELERQKTVLTGAEIDSIAAEDNATVQADRILALGLNEKFTLRLLEIIKDYRTGTQDLKETEEDYNDTLSEQVQLKDEIAIQQRKLNGEIFNEEQEQRSKRITQLKEEIDLIKGETTEKLKLQKELNELLLEDQEKADKKALAKRKQLIEDSVEVLETVLAKSREKQNKELDAEIDSLENRIDDVQNAINNGSSEAAQSLAELEAKKLEAEKQKEELRKKEIRDQKIIAGLQLLASNDGNVGKTLGDVSLLLAALSNLPSFFDGTEDTGTVSNPLDSNGGRTVMLHDNERVLTAKQNAKIGGISNEDLADLGAMHKSGKTNGGTAVIQANNQELIQEVKEMARAIKSMPIQNYNYDNKGKYHEQVIKSNNKKEIRKTRANNIFK